MSSVGLLPGLPLPLRAGRLPPGRRRGDVEPVEVDARTGLHVDKVGDADPEPMRDGEQHVERRVPPPPLYLAEVPEREPDPVSGVPLGPTQTPAGSLDSSGNPPAERLGAHAVEETSMWCENWPHYRSLVPLTRSRLGVTMTMLAFGLD